MKRANWIAGLLALVLAHGALAQGLALAERFGPDGLPFTHDDPLHVGGYASKVRYGAMAGDACSEDIVHLHPNPAQPDIQTTASLGSHPARPFAADYGDVGSPNLVTEAPFDLTIWISGINLENGRVGRYRAFPEMDGWLPNLEHISGERGWIDGWTSRSDPDLDNLLAGGVSIEDTSGDKDMEEVWNPGPPVKNLHLETLGLAYRDIKPKGGFPIAVKQQTLEQFEEFYDADMKDKLNELHMFSQQAYVEAWVTEVMNLETKKTGISGNFVVDMAGLQIIQLMDFKEGPFICRVKFRNVPVDLGGPVGEIPGNYEEVTTYFEEQRWDYIWSQNSGCSIGIAKRIGLRKAKEKMEPMDLAASLMDDERLSGDVGAGTGEDSLYAQDQSLSLYQVIAAYSGLANRGAKNVFDRFALSVLIFFAQFKPTEWSPWAHIAVDADDPLLGFQASLDLETTEDVLVAEAGSAGTDVDQFRYNNGSSYIGKAMWIYGNSDGKDNNGLGTMDPATHRLDTGSSHQRQVDLTPDILFSFAMEWLYIRMDVIDPYRVSEELNRGYWYEKDILIPRDTPLPFYIDWPPPNYSFGRAQVGTLRAASGGTPNTTPGTGALPVVANVNPLTVPIWGGLICIDPVTRTYSMLGYMERDDDGDFFNFAKAYQDELYDPGNDFTWTEPRGFGANGALVDIPDYFEHDSPLRWLTAGANHHFDSESVLRWGWDFDTSNSGPLDSVHAQHVSDIGQSQTGGVFAYQTSGAGSVKGRTGFTLVDMQAPLNP